MNAKEHFWNIVWMKGCFSSSGWAVGAHLTKMVEVTTDEQYHGHIFLMAKLKRSLSKMFVILIK